MAKRITHIRKPDINSTVEHITHVKGTDDKGYAFSEKVADVISALKNNASYYVSVGIYTVDVTYQKSAKGNEYIKTRSDATGKDNLLSLPQF